MSILSTLSTLFDYGSITVYFGDYIDLGELSDYCYYCYYNCNNYCCYKSNNCCFFNNLSSVIFMYILYIKYMIMTTTVAIAIDLPHLYQNE